MQILKDYAMSFVGKPYLWGGNNPAFGADCSGFAQELLASAGIDPTGDQSAQGLFDYFSKNGAWNVYLCGSLAFYGKSVSEITHVAMFVDPYRVIEAGGGDSTTTTLQAAEKKGASVRIRLYDARKDTVAVVRPYYTRIGVGRV